MMFHFKNFPYVREYFNKALQIQDPELVERPENIEDNVSKYSRSSKTLNAVFHGYRKSSPLLYVEPQEASSVVEESFFPSNFSGHQDTKVLHAEALTYQQHNQVLLTQVDSSDKNLHLSLRKRFIASVSQGNAKSFSYITPALTVSERSRVPHLLPPHRQQRPIESASSGGQISLSKSPQASSENQYCTQTYQVTSTYSSTSIDSKSISLPRRGGLVGRLSPLRESSGNAATTHSPNQLDLNIKKTRRPPKSNQTVLKQPVGSISKSTVKLALLDHRISQHHFLGRHRAPSNPELRRIDRSISLLQGRKIARSSSAGTLRHLPSDPQTRLHIGTRNDNIFFPCNQSISHVLITYRLPKRQDTLIPKMAPSFIKKAYPSHPEDVHNVSTANSINQGHTDALLEASSMRDIGEMSHRELNSSSVANAGSQESDVTTANEFYGIEDSLVAPSNSPSTEMTEVGEVKNTLRRNHGHVGLPQLCQPPFAVTNPSMQQGVVLNGHVEAIDPEALWLRLEKVFISQGLDRSNEDQHSVEVAPRTDEVFSADPKYDEIPEAEHPTHIKTHTQTSSNYAIVPETVESFVTPSINHHDSCTQPSKPAGLIRSVSDHTALTQPQHSVSIGEKYDSITSGRVSELSRASVSRADPLYESPTIGEHLRGPSFSADFAESMSTLPPPPVEHDTPVHSCRGSTSSFTQSLALSEQPTGVWAKVKQFFASCF